jgi:hypothetical protein
MSNKRAAGDIVRIPLGDGTHTYARVLPHASFAFYDSRVNEDLAVEEVVKKPILFFLAVMHYAVTRGRWSIVGHVRLNGDLEAPPKFIQDALDKNKFEIYYQDGQTRRAARHECVGLERASVWEPEHVEDRLRDHYAGRKNQWVESQKLPESVH